MSNYLKSLRVRQGLHQEDIAKLLGIASCSYSLKETGKRDFTIAELKKIKDIFKLTAEEFCKVFFEEN